MGLLVTDIFRSRPGSKQNVSVFKNSLRWWRCLPPHLSRGRAPLLVSEEKNRPPALSPDGEIYYFSR